MRVWPAPPRVRRGRVSRGRVSREPGCVMGGPQPVLLDRTSQHHTRPASQRSGRGLAWGPPVRHHHRFLSTLLGDDGSVLDKLTCRGRGGTTQSQASLPMTSFTRPSSPSIINQHPRAATAHRLCQEDTWGPRTLAAPTGKDTYNHRPTAHGGQSSSPPCAALLRPGGRPACTATPPTSGRQHPRKPLAGPGGPGTLLRPTDRRYALSGGRE